MNRCPGWIAAALVVFASVVPLAVFGAARGPVPARTGGFGEMTCQACHWDNELNGTPGQLRLTGVPATYVPRQQYLLSLTLVRADMGRAGFQIASRFETGATAGTNAGELRSIDERTEAVRDEGSQIIYLQHTEAGTEVPTPGTARWAFKWTAPETGGAVVFHVAGNASNGDDSPLGDFIYTAASRSNARD